jgi:UDP-glucose 4-epimerase
MEFSVRFLITGGAGFIGSSLADKLALDPSNHITVIDNLSTGFKKNIPSQTNVHFVKADVNNFHDLSGIFFQGFDYIYHYAAVVGVQRTLDNPISVLRDVEGFRNILDLAKNTGVKRVLFASSSEVYGEPVSMPQHEETTPLNSRLPYAVVKNLGESFLKSYKQEYDLDFTIFRFFNTYGPKQSTDFVMSRFIEAALENRDITIYGDGSQSRTFCYVTDNVEATINALSDEKSINQVINIGNDTETSILELAKKIIKISGSSSKIVHLPPLAEGDMTRRQPDASKMKELLNREFTSLDMGIDILIKHFKKL